MDELGPDEQRWLDALRVDEGPTEADRARNRAAVLARVVGVGAGVAASMELAKVVGSAGAAKAAGGTMAAFLVPWKIGVVVMSLAVAGALTAALVGAPPGNTSASATTTVAAPAAPAATDPVPTAEALTAEAAPVAAAETVPPETAPSSSARTRAHVPAPGATASADDLDGELQLLTEAQQALKRGDPNAALQSLSRHGRDYPRGALAVEREGLRAVASCEAKRPDARALAERFVARSPRSPLVTRVRATCLSP